MKCSIWMEVVGTVPNWKRTAAVAATALGLALTWPGAAALALPAPAVTAQQEQELYQAIQQMLTAAHAARQDMPQRLLSAEQIGADRFRVRCQMVQGEGWFEVWKEGGKWQVKGITPPAS